MPNLRALLMIAWTIFLAIVAMISFVFEPTGRLFIFYARKCWSGPILRMGGVRVTVRGAENVDWTKPYVLCSNHQSAIDIPLLFYAVPVPIRFLSKRSLFYIPIFGWGLFLARFIPVDRAQGKKAYAAINKAARKIAKGPSLVIFPEGTRTPDGKVHEFKLGGFVMAIEAGVPVVPLAIRGTFERVPKNRLAITPGPVEVIIGRPIPTAGMQLKDRGALSQETRRRIEAMFETGEPDAG